MPPMWAKKGTRALRIGLLALAACAAAQALSQPAAAPPAERGVPRIGVLFLDAQAPWGQTSRQWMVEGLKRQGLEEGRDYTLDARSADNQTSRLAAVAEALAASRPVLMYGGGNLVVKALVETTGHVPIVGTGGVGLAARRPDGRATGMTVLQTSLNAKRLELLAELCPRGATLLHIGEPESRADMLPRMEQASRERGLKPLSATVRTPADVDAAVALALRERACGVNILESSFLLGLHAHIFQRAREARLPTMGQWPEMAAQGAVLAYGPSRRAMNHQAMAIVARVLRGEKPADIPIETPLRFDLVVNLRQARAIGLVLPATLLARADEVIE